MKVAKCGEVLQSASVETLACFCYCSWYCLYF